jgi:hypothetical protein
MVRTPERKSKNRDICIVVKQTDIKLGLLSCSANDMGYSCAHLADGPEKPPKIRNGMLPEKKDVRKEQLVSVWYLLGR